MFLSYDGTIVIEWANTLHNSHY